jgi:hypothetical protein
MIDTRESLFALLPAYVRQRDLQGGGALKELLAIVADQVMLLERDFARMYDNWFIETCEDWVVPYIADLLGYGAPGSSASSGSGAASGVSTPRREIANLLAYRRRKGTVALLDAMARDAAGWPAETVEFYRRLVVAQHLDHVHLHRPDTADLHAARALAVPELPFDRTSHLADVRRTSNAESPGLYNPSGLGLFVFRMQSFTVSSTSAYCREDIGAHCYSFSILGNDAPLYRHTVPARNACVRTEPTDLPRPIGRLELEHDAPPDAAAASIDPAFYGDGRSIAIDVPEWPKKEADGGSANRGFVPPEAVIPADLSDWSYKVPKNRVAVDPVLGRIMFPAGQAPRKGVKVSYAYGFAMNLGGGEYMRPLPPMPAHVSRRRVRALDADPPGEGEFQSIEAAVVDWQKQRAAEHGGVADPKRASALPALVVELVDSGVYRGALDVSLGRGESLWIIAAPQTRPVLWLTDESAGAVDAISIRGAMGSRFTMDGILVAGRGINIAPANGEPADDGGVSGANGGTQDLCEILIRHCTLVPGWGLSHDCAPRRPSEPSIVLDESRACLRIDHSIVGAIRVNVDGADGPTARVLIDDSIVDATSQTRTAIGAAADTLAFARLGIARSTIIGAVLVHEIDCADDSLFVGDVTVARRQTGCIRYSYVPQGSRTPRRHRCQPDGVIAAIPVPVPPAKTDPAQQALLVADAILRAVPRFVATHYGSPDYLRLTACTTDAIARGAESGSEMGVYHDSSEPQRLDRLSACLHDYAPADVDASVLIAS